METNTHTPAEHAAHDHIEVAVRYPAAPKPFIDPKASRAETLGHLKARVLSAFGLTEISGADGQTLYFLYHDNTRLDDVNQTLGQIAGHEHTLKLKLVQQLVQG